MAMQRRLATIDKLTKWGIHVDQSCTLCGRDIEETHDHLFFECSYSQTLWNRMLRWLEYHRSPGSWDVEVQWLTANVNNRSPKKTLLGVVFAAVVYNIWMERNKRRFQQQKREVKDRAKDIVIQVHIAGQKKLKWLPILESLNNYSDSVMN
uniref:Reverse transcriptase zinc-binding domain-containing protein n=1 Tax=Nicotiana tabacum TaxID=4097 RepID=A0A1S4D626_TOBAC|nr:PREDICTED: uncharacterized protein LOC107826344 [Nicotiana tabacum]